MVAAARARAGRGETLSLIESGQLDGAKPSVAAPARAVAPTRTAAPTEVATPPGSADVESASEDTAEVETAAPTPAPESTDPETAKRLATIQAAEKRSRDQTKAARAEVEASARKLETEWAPRIKAAEDFEALRAKAKRGSVHLVDAVRALGIGEDDFEAAAQALYAHSKAGAADPARKGQAERMLREREEATRVDATQKRLEELEAKLESKDRQSEFQTLQSGYLDGAVDTIADTSPIARAAVAAIEKARAAGTPADKARAGQLATKLRGKLWEITVALTEELGGDVPDFADVIARYEDLRGAELDELGIPRPTAATTTPKQNAKPAEKQTPARTLSNDLSTTRVPRPTQSGDVHRKDHRKESLRMIESGKLE